MDGAERRPGFVIALEPTLPVKGVGPVNVEDMVLVTEDGREPPTRFPRATLVVGGAR